MEKNRRRLNKGCVALLVVLGILLMLVLGAFTIVKVYLGQMERIDEDVLETIAPEDEFFDEDVEPTTSIPTTSVDVPQGTHPDSEEPTVGEIPTEPEKTTEPVTEPDTGAPAETQPKTDETLNAGPENGEWPFIERIEDDHLINILLVGQDKYPGTISKARQRSDSMILCSINPETGKISMISFLRDMYVEIPGGYSNNRLNIPFVFGGFPLLNKTLTTNFGISIDANFMVDMTGFKAIIERLGGVDIKLTAEEAAYLQKHWGGDIHEGVNRLDADYALHYAQLRVIGSDFARTGRQRKVLMSIFNEVKNLPVDKLLTLLYDMLPYMSTDLSDAEILSLAYRLLPMMSSVSVDTYSIPSAGTYRNAKIRKMSVLVIDREKIRKQLQDEYLPLG